MPTTQSLNLSSLEEDRLLVLWKRFHYRSALGELMARHENSIHQLVVAWARDKALTQEELAEALQQAFLSFEEAVKRFNAKRSDAASFRTFLGMVVWRRLSKFARA